MELLVVLALVGLLVGVATPRAMNWVEGAQARAVVNEARAIIESQPAQAFFAGEARVIVADAKSAELLRIPHGWRLEVSAPIRYEANGMTTGGEVRLWEGKKLRADWRVLPPAGVLIEARREE